MRRLQCIPLLLVPLLAYSPNNYFTVTTADKYLWGIAAVESNFDISAYNRKENAVGLLQIRPVCVLDANRISNRGYTHEEMYNPFKAITVFYIISNYYGGTVRERIERWNGGGIRNGRTEQYYKNVIAKSAQVYTIQNNSRKYPVRRWYVRDGKEYVFD